MRNRKLWKRSALLFLSIPFFLICGCAGGELEETQTKGETQKEKFQWYINYSWFTGEWGESAVSQAITEKTGVDIEFVTPTGNENDQLKALIKSNQLPDLITLGWWEEPVSLMLEEEQVYALNELADQYAPCFWEAAEPEVCSWYEQEDGNLYGYPNYFYTQKDYEEEKLYTNITCLVRRDMYEALGCPDMTTTEGFYKAITEAWARFPKVNGKELIPLGVHEFDEFGCDSFGKFLQNFLAVPYEQDGEIYDRFMDEEYLRWLKMFRRLGVEGYLKPDIFVDKRPQMEEKILDGRYFCMIYQWRDMESQQRILYEKNKDSSYIAVDGPRNKNGADYQLPGTGINGWTLTFISKNCRNPKKAIQFLSFLMGEEGQKLIGLGIEGVTYDLVNGIPVLKEEVKKLLDTDRNEYDRLYGANSTYWMIRDSRIQSQWEETAVNTDISCVQMEEWTRPYVVNISQYEQLLENGASENKIDSRIKSAWGRILPKLLTAESEEQFDRYIEEFRRKRDEEGYARLLDAQNRQLQINKKKLGLSE